MKRTPNKKLRKSAKQYRKRYKEARKERKIELFELKRTLDAAIAHDIKQFHTLLNRLMRILAIDDATVAHILMLSPGTILRWRCGSSLPHPAMRRAVYKEFLHRTLETLSVYDHM